MEENVNLDKLNDKLMPTANDIKSKMEFLQNKYKFKMDPFAFTEIKIEDLTK